jgi:hypothetical protein
MNTGDAPLLCILVDALRHDYLDRPETPRLTQIARAGTSRKLRPILGYSDAIRAVIFSGQYPDEHGYWMEYCYRPESSPWAGMSRWATLDRLPSDFVQRVVKFGASGTVLRRQARRSDLPHMDLRHVPMRAIDRFDLTLRSDMTAPGALGTQSIFDACRETGREFSYLSSTKLNPTELLRAVDEVPSETALIFVYLHQVDMVSHISGVDSSRFSRTLRAVDELAGDITARVSARFPAARHMIFADHGMSTLRRQVSLEGLVKHPAFPKRFFAALDATMVRLWFFDNDDRLRDWARDYISTRLPGRFLTPADRDELHLRFDGDLYGEEIFLTDPGWGIFPNFHSYIRPKAMHAYHPDDTDQWGVFLGPASLEDELADVVQMVDIAPLIKAELGVTQLPRQTGVS